MKEREGERERERKRKREIESERQSQRRKREFFALINGDGFDTWEMGVSSRSNGSI